MDDVVVIKSKKEQRIELLKGLLKSGPKHLQELCSLFAKAEGIGEEGAYIYLKRVIKDAPGIQHIGGYGTVVCYLRGQEDKANDLHLTVCRNQTIRKTRNTLIKRKALMEALQAGPKTKEALDSILTKRFPECEKSIGQFIGKELTALRSRGTVEVEGKGKYKIFTLLV